MGNWEFEISGVGPHHNGKFYDVDVVLSRAMCVLRRAQAVVGPWTFKVDQQETELNPDMTGLDFSTALTLLKLGAKIRRRGWNGKGMWLILTSGDGVVQPCITMRTADALMQPGWLASQADMLGEDWEVVSPDAV